MAKKGYTAQGDIENYLLKDIDVSFADQIDDWIENVERIIDGITERNFIADSTASARVYDGSGVQRLMIDDCVEITKVEQGQDSYGGSFSEISATGSDRYHTYPANASANGVPIQRLVLTARTWPKGMQNNRITAKWGYSAAVPADIKFVATVFVAGIVNNQVQGGDEIQSERIGNYQVTYRATSGQNSWADFQMAKEILEKYRRINI